MAMTAVRSFAKSPFAAALFGLLVVGFLFTSKDMFNGIAGGGFVSAGDRKIEPREVNQALNRILDNQREQTGKVVTLKEAAQQGMTAQVLSQMIDQELTLAYADKVGIKASPKAVTDYLVTNAPRFKDALGRINTAALAQYAGEQGMSVKEFEEQLRDGLTYDYLTRALFAGVTTPKVLAQPLAAYLGEQRTFSMARLTPAATPAPPTATEDQLKAYYTEHVAQFAVPERRAISIISYSPEDFVDKAPVTDAQVKSEYDRRIKEFSGAETRTFEQFTSKDRAAVQGLVDNVKGGAKVEDELKKFPAVTMVSITAKPADIKDKDYSTAIFGVPVNQIAGPFTVGEDKVTWYGWRVTAITPGAATPIEKVSEQLHHELAEKEAKRLYSQSAESFSDLVGGGAALEEISTEIGAPVIQLDGVDRSGVHPSLGKVSLLTAHLDALQHIFEAKAGETSEVIEGDNERMVMRLDAIIPKRTQTLDEVREKVRALWTGENQKKLADGVVESFLQQVKGGKDWDKTADDMKLLKGRFANAGRSGSPNQPREIDPAVLEPAFALAKGETKLLRDSNGEPWAVRVDAVTPLNEAQAAGLSKQVDAFVARSLTNDMQELFSRDLQKEVNVKVNQKAIEDYLASFTKEDQ